MLARGATMRAVVSQTLSWASKWQYNTSNVTWRSGQHHWGCPRAIVCRTVAHFAAQPLRICIRLLGCMQVMVESPGAPNPQAITQRVARHVRFGWISRRRIYTLYVRTWNSRRRTKHGGVLSSGACRSMASRSTTAFSRTVECRIQCRSTLRSPLSKRFSGGGLLKVLPGTATLCLILALVISG